MATGITTWGGAAASVTTALLVLPVAAGLMLATIGEEIGWRGYLLT